MPHQVLQEEGLNNYATADVVKATEIEIAETFNVSPADLETAAERILVQISSQPQSPKRWHYFMLHFRK